MDIQQPKSFCIRCIDFHSMNTNMNIIPSRITPRRPPFNPLAISQLFLCFGGVSTRVKKTLMTIEFHKLSIDLEWISNNPIHLPSGASTSTP